MIGASIPIVIRPLATKEAEASSSFYQVNTNLYSQSSGTYFIFRCYDFRRHYHFHRLTPKC